MTSLVRLLLGIGPTNFMLNPGFEDAEAKKPAHYALNGPQA